MKRLSSVESHMTVAVSGTWTRTSDDAPFPDQAKSLQTPRSWRDGDAYLPALSPTPIANQARSKFRPVTRPAPAHDRRESRGLAGMASAQKFTGTTEPCAGGREMRDTVAGGMGAHSLDGSTHRNGACAWFEVDRAGVWSGQTALENLRRAWRQWFACRAPSFEGKVDVGPHRPAMSDARRRRLQAAPILRPETV